MTYQDRDPLENPGARMLAGERIRPTDTIRPADRGSRTLWSWVTFLAIIGVLFVVFYGINAEQDRAKQTASASLPTAAETAPAAGESKSDTGEKK